MLGRALSRIFELICWLEEVTGEPHCCSSAAMRLSKTIPTRVGLLHDRFKTLLLGSLHFREKPLYEANTVTRSFARHNEAFESLVDRGSSSLQRETIAQHCPGSCAFATFDVGRNSIRDIFVSVRVDTCAFLCHIQMPVSIAVQIVKIYTSELFDRVHPSRK